MSAARLFRGAALGVALIAACSGADRPPPFAEEPSAGGQGGSGGAGGGGGGGLDGGILLDGFDFDANCGYQAVNARQEPARIQVVLDRSGSMGDSVGGVVKYSAAKAALIKLVERVGWRSEIGATLYPSKGGVCAAGSEVFSMRPGDTKSFFDEGKQGPVTTKFAQAIASNPSGGTPTGKTLAALVPKLKGLGKNTYVLLATDGGPNCNDEASCEAKDCIPNIEKLDGCSASLNCCDPALDPKFSTNNCLDADATLSAVLALSQEGIKTIVIGIPGSAEYASLLDLLAVAGGAPREGSTRYYRVDDLNSLEEVLLKIGSEVTVSCDISLDEPPHDPDEVNVYFDQTLVPSGEQDGWVWTGETSLSLRGKACETMLSGAVRLVQVVVGCPTQFVK